MTAAADRLRQHAELAFDGREESLQYLEARLCDLAGLCADMADALAGADEPGWLTRRIDNATADALLARLDTLTADAGPV